VPFCIWFFDSDTKTGGSLIWVYSLSFFFKQPGPTIYYYPLGFVQGEEEQVLKGISLFWGHGNSIIGNSCITNPNPNEHLNIVIGYWVMSYNLQPNNLWTFISLVTH